MSEQAGVMAELDPQPDGTLSLLLLELLTLQPLGKAALRLQADRVLAAHAGSSAAVATQRTPTFVSIQRRSPTTWLLVLELPKRPDATAADEPISAPDDGDDGGAVIECWLVRARESAEAVRARAPAGPPADARLDDPSAALHRAPALEVSALRIIDLSTYHNEPSSPSRVASEQRAAGSEQRWTVPRRVTLDPSWPTFDRHRSRWLVVQHSVERSAGLERPILSEHTALLDLESGELSLSDVGWTGGAWAMHAHRAMGVGAACADLRLLWSGREEGAATEALPWVLLEVPHTNPQRGESTFEIHQMELVCGGPSGRRGAEARSGDGTEGGGDEGGEEEEAATRNVRRLVKKAILRTTPASALLRQLRDSNAPKSFVLWRPDHFDVEPLLSAANWRWLVLLDMSGVHILDFGGRQATDRAEPD
jgi:hypothetical protein